MSSPASTPRRSPRIAASPAKRLSITELEQQQYKLLEEYEKEDQEQQYLQVAQQTVKKYNTTKGGNVRGKKRGNKRQKTVAQEDQEVAELDAGNLDLIDVIKNHPELISAAAKKWLQDYVNNNIKGMAELWTLIVQVAGSDTVIGEEDMSSLRIDELLKQMADRVKQDGLQGQMFGRGFKAILDGSVELVEKIVQRASQNNVLYDTPLLDNLFPLITGLSISKVRQFRSVATMICTEISTACVKVMANLTAAQDTAQRQLTAEQRKRDNNPDTYNSATCEALIDQIQQDHGKRQQLLLWLKGACSRVFTHRLRDCCEDIRAYVVDGMGEWMKDLPSEFLNDGYLKYIAWSLSDKSAKVRQSAVTRLQDLYSLNNQDDTHVLYEFTKRFRDRFRELIFDVDDEVAVQGIKLVTTLVGLKEMGEDDVCDIYWVLVDENMKLRHAAAKLAGQLMTTQGEQELDRIVQLTPLRPQKGGKYSKQQKQLAGLLHMMKLLSYAQESSSFGRSSSIQERALECEFVEQLVDALFDELNVLTQWSKLCEMILAEDACYHWGNPAITNLIHVLQYSLGKAKAMMQSKGKNIATAAQQRVHDATLVLITALPTMLRNFQSDENKVLSLVKVVRNMRLEVYSERKQEAEYEELLGLVSTVFFKSKEENVLQECAATLAHCSQVGPEILTDMGRHVLGSVVEQSAVKFFTASQDVEALPEDSLSDIVIAIEEGTGSDDDIYALQLALRRVYALLLWCGGLLEREDAHDALNGLLEDTASSSTRYLGSVITSMLLRNMQLMLMWGLHHTGSESSSETQIQQLKGRLDSFLTQSEKIFDLYPGSSKIRETVMQTWLECCCLFSAEKLQDTYLQAVAYEPAFELVRKYWNFCQELLEETNTRDIEADEEGQSENQEGVVRQSSIMSVSQMGEEVVSVRARKEIREKNVVRKLDLLKGFGRLVLSGLVGEQSRWWIFSRMISLSASHGNEFFELIKAIQKSVRKTSPAAIPPLFIEAMKAAYEKLIRIEDNVDLWQEFEHLCQMLASYYRGLSSEGNQVRKIVEAGIEYGLQQPPSNFEFLYSGISHFSSKVPAKDVDALVTAVQNHVNALEITSDSSEDQLPLLYFLQRLEQHAVKAKAPRRGGLKTAATNQNKPGNRKIQFIEDKENQDVDTNLPENNIEAGPSHAGSDFQQNFQKVVNQFVSTQLLQEQENLNAQNDRSLNTNDILNVLNEDEDSQTDQQNQTDNQTIGGDEILNQQRSSDFGGGRQTSYLCQNTSNRDNQVLNSQQISGSGQQISGDELLTPGDKDDVENVLTQDVTLPSIGLNSSGEQEQDLDAEQQIEDTQGITQSHDGIQNQNQSGSQSEQDGDDLYTSGQQQTHGTSNNIVTSEVEEGDGDSKGQTSGSRKRNISTAYDEQSDSQVQGRTSDEIEPPAKWTKRRRISVPKHQAP